MKFREVELFTINQMVLPKCTVSIGPILLKYIIVRALEMVKRIWSLTEIRPHEAGGKNEGLCRH